MKRYKLFIYIGIVFILLFIIAIYSYNANKKENKVGNQAQNSTNTSASRTSSIVNENNNIELNANAQNTNIISEVPKEQEISAYSTTIKDNSAGRLTNISITCSTLNDTIIHSKETFSFNKTVGKPTSERGYQEAKVIIDHKTETGIGGGNCQVSSTLYNAVLAVPSLVVTERHEHGKDVTYVPEGKDAAVSYGSLDLKFRNDTGHDVKIVATTDNKTITIKLIQL